MTVFIRICCYFAISALSINVSADSVRQWSQAVGPSSGPTGGKSIGAYNNGCLAAAQALPLNGEGYQVMRLSRKRYYGHADLINFIESLGKTAATENLGSLLIGDLGQARGGPALSGHLSHQTGLDVDIWFLLLPPGESRILTENERETWNAPSMVDEQLDRMDDSLWSQNHARILEAAASRAVVDRIFVNPSIKKRLCNNSNPSSATWLRKIRPWWKHSDHFHVRLRCPANSPDCQAQEPLPAGDGCDKSLDWWFSAEAKTPAKTKPTPPPPLPSLCEQVLLE